MKFVPPGVLRGINDIKHGRTATKEELQQIMRDPSPKQIAKLCRLTDKDPTDFPDINTNLNVVMINDDRELLVHDTFDAEFFVYSPGPTREYENRERVEDIEPGKELPERFRTHDWHPADPKFRFRLENA